MYFQIFIPTSLSGWKFCLKQPKLFFKMGTWRIVGEWHFKGIIEERERCERVFESANKLLNEAYDARKESVAELKRIRAGGSNE